MRKNGMFSWSAELFSKYDVSDSLLLVQIGFSILMGRDIYIKIFFFV